MERLIDQFEAEGDGGQRYTVQAIARVIRSRPLSGASQELLGSRRFALTDGRHVNSTDDPNVFRIVDTDEVIRRL